MTTSKASSLLAMAIIGGAIVTLPRALLAQPFRSLEAADIVALEAYIFIAYDSLLAFQVRATGTSEVLP